MSRRALAVVSSLGLAAWAGGDVSKAPVVLGLDHIPVAVANLEEAAARYRSLGFTLKPGRPHDNGIRNQHAKLADGTEADPWTLARAPGVPLSSREPA